MIKNNSYYEFFASYKVPNGDQVGYWIDLGANPNGKVIKVYNSNIRKWVKVTDATSEDAVAPYIGSNGNWFVDSRDTGVPASGKNPYVGENGNWFVFNALENKYVDSGVIAKGKTAYDLAVENGYDGSYDDYIKVLQDIITYSELVKEATANANSAAENANDAADRSNTIANNPPKIVNEVWYMYDEETGNYVSTGVKAIGDAFTIVKTYPSVAEMQADYTGEDVKIGQFVMIDTGDVNNPEDSQLYLKGDTEWKFISDLSGAQGIQGLSAYQVAVQEGFVGTEEEWLQSLKGDKGDKGDIGNTGPQGEPGIAATIEVGETVTLEPGESALVENTGNETNAVLKFSLPKGAKGDKGDKGDTGEGLNIKGALDSENDLPADGQLGDAYIIDGNLYVYVGEGGSVVTNPKWSNVGNIKGEKGDQGEQGPQGDPGTQGEPGEPGKDGVSATIEVGTVTSSEPGTQPTITNVGDSTNAIFNFTIPKGAKGDKGDQGEKGEPGESYSLPIASSDTLGGIKVGAGLEINPGTGVLSATGGGTADAVDWANITSKPDFKTVATTGSYNDLIDKPTIPTKTSELTNDSGFITSIPEEYVTETELAGKNYATVSQIPSLDGYATEAWVGEQGYLTEHQDISNLATKEELALKADSANVYSKSETYTKTETDSAIKQASATVFKYKGAVDNYEGLPTEEVSVGDVYSLRDTNGEYVATKASPEPTWEYLGVEVDLSQYSTTVENDGKYQPKGDYITNSTFTSSLNNKVDKDGDKVLSTNDFTTELKSKLEGIEAGAQVNKVTSVAGRTGQVTLTKTDVGLDQVDNTSDLNKPISTATQEALDSKADISAIPTKLSELTNDSNYLTDAPSDGKQYGRKDGSWAEIEAGGTQYLDLSMFSESSGTLSEEDYQKVVKAYEDGVNVFLLPESDISLTAIGSIIYSDNVYGIVTSVSIFYGNDISSTYYQIIIDNSKTYAKTLRGVITILSGSGTKALTDNGQYAEFAKPVKIERVFGSSQVTKQLSPNKFYKFEKGLISLTITLAAEESGIVNEYMFEFVNGSTPTTLSVPSTVKWSGGSAPTIEANKTYQVSIVNNLAVYASF